MTSKFEDLRAAVTNYIVAEQNMHQMYGTTATCRTGMMGGAAMTMHCSHTCGNGHGADRDQYQDALRELLNELDKTR